MTISRQSLFLIVSYAVFIIFLMIFETTDAMYILVPAISAVWISLLSVVKVWRQDDEIPVFDVGILCILFATLYTVIPLFNFYFGGLEFGPLSDTRLQNHSPSAKELGAFFYNHLSYLLALALGYLIFRKSNRALVKVVVTPINPAAIKIILGISFGFVLYFGMLFFWGIGFKTGYGDETHISLGPLWLQQINGKFSDLQFVFTSAIVGYFVLKKHKFWARGLLFLWIAYQVGTAFIYPGSRGEALNLIVLALLFWHAYSEKKTHFAPTLICVLVSFSAFMFLGVYRSFSSIGEMVAHVENFKMAASATNEFQSVLGTGFDVYKMLENGVDIPHILVVNDFIPLLPPQQFLSFPKLTGGQWYLTQIGQDGTGVGFMWTVIAQSLIGFGWVELAIRGFILGLFLAKVHEWYQRRLKQFLPSVIYANLCLATLWTFRDTTGAILWTIIWQLLPFYFILYFFGCRSEFSPFSAQRSTSTGALSESSSAPSKKEVVSCVLSCKT